MNVPNTPQLTTNHKLFFSRIPTVNYAFKDGTLAKFLFHKFATEDETQIAELEAECKKGHPIYYVDPEHTHITEAELNPMKAMRDKIIAEYLAEQAGQLSPENDRGSSDQGALKTANTTNIAANTLEGSTLARLMQLQKPGAEVTPRDSAKQA